MNLNCASGHKKRRLEFPSKDEKTQILSVTTQDEDTITDLKKRLDKSEEENEQLDGKIETTNDLLKKIEERCKEITKENEILREKNEKSLEQLQQTESEIKVLKSESEEARRIQETKAIEVESSQQTINTLEKKVEGLQGEKENTIRSLQDELNVLKQRLKKEQEDATRDVKELKNEKQLAIDHYTQQVQSRDNEIQRLHGQIRQLSENNAQNEKFCRQQQEELQSFKSELERKENTLQTVVKQRDEERTLKEDERKQKDEALTRLSAIAGDRLRNNNPGITDLSDPNRPMKIAEKFTEMYDNDWTDSMEALEDLDLGEGECVKILLHFLTDSYEECGRLVAELDSHILKAVIISTCEQDTNESGDNKPQDQNIPAELLKPMKDLRKKLTENNVEKLQKKLPDYLMKARDLTEEHITACSKFVADCIKYAWMMQIQDPPVYIEWDFPSDTKIDTNILRSYTKAGDHVDFIVWPVLYLHKDGPVLNKGVVQPKSANK
ncbi:interaptin-like [Mytilus trossulus]|uniref:interaptin-like n=1 Tax=Mytilus trossulus TaxID=6551 RepID=UPI003007719C